MTDFSILTDGPDGITVAALDLAVARLTAAAAMTERARRETLEDEPRAKAIKVRRRFALRAAREAVRAASVAVTLLEADLEGTQ